MRKYFAIIIITGFSVLFDQVAKKIIRTSMTPGESIPTTDEFFNILYLQNDGIAFSLFQGNRWLLVGIQVTLIIAIIVVMLYVIRKIHSKVIIVSFSMMLGGGIGNLIDRVFLGKVVDFISIGNFAVFNIADMSLTIGCGIMLIYLFTSDKHKENLEQEVSSDKHKEHLEQEVSGR